MTTFEANKEIISFSEKFGLITNNQIIITKGDEQNKIKFESIKKVNLAKKRVFYTNSITFLLAVGLLMYTYFTFESEKVEIYYSISFISLLSLIYSIINKSYSYKLTIKVNDNSIHELKTSQMNRKHIKEFYNAIVERISKTQKKEITITKIQEEQPLLANS